MLTSSIALMSVLGSPAGPTEPLMSVWNEGAACELVIPAQKPPSRPDWCIGADGVLDMRCLTDAGAPGAPSREGERAPRSTDLWAGVIDAPRPPAFVANDWPRSTDAPRDGYGRRLDRPPNV